MVATVAGRRREWAPDDGGATVPAWPLGIPNKGNLREEGEFHLALSRRVQSAMVEELQWRSHKATDHMCHIRKDSGKCHRSAGFSF